jgi:hypothetical protein
MQAAARADTSRCTIETVEHLVEVRQSFFSEFSKIQGNKRLNHWEWAETANTSLKLMAQEIEFRSDAAKALRDWVERLGEINEAKQPIRTAVLPGIVGLFMANPIGILAAIPNALLVHSKYRKEVEQVLKDNPRFASADFFTHHYSIKDNGAFLRGTRGWFEPYYHDGYGIDRWTLDNRIPGYYIK